MLCLAGAAVCAEVRSSSESLPLELSSLLEDEELLESEELSPLLSWSMTRASAINSAHASARKAQENWENARKLGKCSPETTQTEVEECLTAPLSMSSMGEFGEAFPLGGEVLELGKDLLLLLLLLLFICWPRRLVCCSSREWILLLPSALQENRSLMGRNSQASRDALPSSRQSV